MKTEIPEAKHCVIFLCGGSGTRMRGSVPDKIFAPLAGTPALARELRAFEAAGIFARAIFVFRDTAQREKISELAEKFAPELARHSVFCRGGNERKDSVLNGLRAAKDSSENSAGTLAFIHDGARPLVPATVLRQLAETATREGGAVLARRCKNTVKRVPAGTPAETACATEDLDRSRLWETETPQVFPLEKILAAYENVAAKNLSVTDDVAAAATLGLPVALVENPFPNPKITTPDDLAFCEVLLAARQKAEIEA